MARKKLGLVDAEAPKTTEKQAKKASSNRWYAFLIEKITHELVIVECKTQKELKDSLKTSTTYDLKFVVRGRQFEFEIQNTFKFQSGNPNIAQPEAVAQ